MIRLKTKTDIIKLREGGRRLAQILQTVKTKVIPGVSTASLDALAQEMIKELGDKPAFLNYRPAGVKKPYPAALCVSVNDEIVHGIPGARVLQEGDLVTIDLGLKHDGLITDSAITVPVGRVSPEAISLMTATEESLKLAIKAVKPGATIGDIGVAVETYIKKQGLGLVRDLAGHGVGYAVHEEPLVPNYGHKGQGEVLRPGLVIAIEPMVTLGSEKTKVLDDEYTFITKDGSLSAHFEHTVVVTDKGVEVLTTCS
ncbi:MAG: type I methionyl aminopeptidase [Candidatus Paceibacterota bacterium]